MFDKLNYYASYAEKLLNDNRDTVAPSLFTASHHNKLMSLLKLGYRNNLRTPTGSRTYYRKRLVENLIDFIKNIAIDSISSNLSLPHHFMLGVSICGVRVMLEDRRLKEYVESYLTTVDDRDNIMSMEVVGVVNKDVVLLKFNCRKSANLVWLQIYTEAEGIEVDLSIALPDSPSIEVEEALFQSTLTSYSYPLSITLLGGFKFKKFFINPTYLASKLQTRHNVVTSEDLFTPAALPATNTTGVATGRYLSEPHPDWLSRTLDTRPTTRPTSSQSPRHYLNAGDRVPDNYVLAGYDGLANVYTAITQDSYTSLSTEAVLEAHETQRQWRNEPSNNRPESDPVSYDPARYPGLAELQHPQGAVPSSPYVTYDRASSWANAINPPMRGTPVDWAGNAIFDTFNDGLEGN